MTDLAVAHAAALALVRKYLSPLRGWHRDKEQRLAEVLQSCAVSLAHAEATLATFESEVPTPAEIRDAAHTQKQRLYPEPDPVEQWKADLRAESGDDTPRPFTPEPAPVKISALPPQGSPEVFLLIAKRLGIRMSSTYWGRVSWGTIYAAMQEMGYRLNSDQERMLTGAVLPPPQPAQVITEKDIEAALLELDRRRESRP